MEIEKAQSEATIKAFLQQMSTQDNRGTGFPIFYVIRTSTWKPTDEERTGGESKIIWWDSGNEMEYSEAKYAKLPDARKSKCERVCVEKTWREEGLFLTETDAKGHLTQNHYHYSDDAHTFVKHAFRAPELERFLTALFQYFDVKLPPR
ncbi:MAG: hypothetical protein PHP45_03425 [Elusimicrobiales bacterium]|nr:hypothetical protein [Elusimicrobiales bacterium]